MSIQDLSPGDKLSLKGKLFDLQHKFAVLQMERDEMEDCTFSPVFATQKSGKPTKASGKASSKEFLEGVSSAEVARKEHLEVIRRSIMVDDRDQCTFKPKINKRSSISISSGVSRPSSASASASASLTTQTDDGQTPKRKVEKEPPIYERLFQKGKEYDAHLRELTDVRRTLRISLLSSSWSSSFHVS